MLNYIKKHITVLYFVSGIIILCALGIILSADFKSFVDLDLNDEGNYLFAGKNIMTCGTRIMYPLWYKFIQLFQLNDIATYYLNQQLNIILLPVCIYVLLYTYFRNITFSLFFSILFLYSNTNVATEYILNDFTFCWAMKLNNFTLGVLCLLTCIIYYFKKRGYSAISLFTFSFLILSYCRNEYCLLFIISILTYGVYFLWKLRTSKREVIVFFFIVLTSLILIIKLGLSITATEHSYLAYAQGYTRNYLQMKELSLFPNIDLYTQSDKIFGNAKSIADFFFSNPLEFIKNSIFNVYNMLVINSYRVSDVLLPQIFINYKDKSTVNYVISWLVIIALGIYIIKNFKLKNALQNPALLFLTICIIPTIIYCVLYVFEPRYFLFFVPLLYICIIHFLIHLKQKKYIEYVLLVIIACIIIYHPTAADYFKKNRCFIDQRIVSSISIIEKYKKDKQTTYVKILSNDGNFDKFIPNSSCLNISANGTHTTKEINTNLNFMNFDVIILTENKAFSSQSLIYNNLIEFLKDNDSFTHIVDYKKNVNLYLRK